MTPPENPPAFQDTKDWKEFSRLWMVENGHYPRLTVRDHREGFYWFTQGAHAEMMGRLTPPPNARKE